MQGKLNQLFITRRKNFINLYYVKLSDSNRKNTIR